MNPKIKKVSDDIEKTRAKIAELQALLPELERKKTDMENTEIIKLFRSADIAPADIPDFIKAIKTPDTVNVTNGAAAESLDASASGAPNTSSYSSQESNPLSGLGFGGDLRHSESESKYSEQGDGYAGDYAEE